MTFEPNEYYPEFRDVIEIRLCSAIEFQLVDCVRLGSIDSIAKTVRLTWSGRNGPHNIYSFDTEVFFNSRRLPQTVQGFGRVVTQTVPLPK